MKNLYAVNSKTDHELYAIIEIISEAYYRDAEKTALLDIDEHKICYILLSLWCRDEEDKATLLRIILKVIELFPNRVEDIIDFLICKPAFINSESLEVRILHSMVMDYSSRRLH